MPTIKIHNVEIDEIIEREMNGEELNQWETDKNKVKAEAQAQEESQAKREAALAKLAALGLEEDDLKALGL